MWLICKYLFCKCLTDATKQVKLHFPASYCVCLLQSLAWAEISRGGSKAGAPSPSAITSQTTSWWSVSASCFALPPLHFTIGFISEFSASLLCKSSSDSSDSDQLSHLRRSGSSERGDVRPRYTLLTVYPLLNQEQCIWNSLLKS